MVERNVLSVMTVNDGKTNVVYNEISFTFWNKRQNSFLNGWLGQVMVLGSFQC